jgi:asparagine synthase (glutamine-hydrolysing)
MCGIFLIKKETISDTKTTTLYFKYDYKTVLNEFNKGKNRGPDDTKFMDLVNYYIGFHRLSINGLNSVSNQPFIKNDTYLICNGEIYNYKELYNQIGIKPETDSDCEIISDLYQLYPIDYFINLLDGVFSFIIYNVRKQEIVVGRDPFGVRPLFCDSGLNYFSSDLKQICNLTNETISQFPPGNYLIKNKSKTELLKYHNLVQYYLPQCSQYKNFNDERNFYKSMIRGTLINAVKKRLMSDRPIACLLSGGLDSSLITSIVVELQKDLPIKTKLETYSIGLKGSTDLEYAKKVADNLRTNHTEIVVTEDDFFDAIPEVVEKIESYDTTTIRASVGNYLVAKYISEHSEAKVIFNGDGADELTGGYLYFHKAPNKLLFDYEIKNLLSNISHFDVLRSDKSISSCGLEPRTPFLDKTFVNTYLSIPLNFRKEEGIEKKILRESFIEFLPNEVLYRKKEAFSDGVSGTDRSWFKIIEEKLKYIKIPGFEYNENHLSPQTKEQMYYRYLFEQKFPKRENIIPYFWMPKWSNTTDPSARTL